MGEKSDYDFQYFNMIRRVARELFVHGYRGNFSDFINLSSANKYKSRVNRIFYSLDQHMSWDEQEKKWMTTDQMRISNNPFYYLLKSRSMDNSDYALFFSLVDMLSNGVSLSLEQIYKKIDYDIISEEILPASGPELTNRIRQFIQSCSVEDGERRLPDSKAFICRLPNDQYRLITSITKKEIKEELYPGNDLVLALLRILSGRETVSFNSIVDALIKDPALHNYYALAGWTIDDGQDDFETTIKDLVNEIGEEKKKKPKPTKKTRLFNILKDYCDAGILVFDETKKTYALPPVQMCDLLKDHPGLASAIAFFSEYSPLGIVGSYLMDEHEIQNRTFVFKNKYIAQALDMIVLQDLLTAIHRHAVVKIYVEQYSGTVGPTSLIVPIRIFSRSVDGRQFVYAYHLEDAKFMTARLDNIYSVMIPQDEETAAALAITGKQIDDIINEGIARLPYIWSSGLGKSVREICIKFRDDNKIMLSHISRESRIGTVKQLENGEIAFSADMYQAVDMVPWLLGYTGRITSIHTQKNEGSGLVSRMVRHINGLHQIYHNNTENEYTQKPTEYTPAPENSLEIISPRSDRSDLFQPYHSKYIACLKGILDQIRVPRTEEEINSIIIEQKKRFGIGSNDREISFDKLLDSGEENDGNGLIKPYPIYQIYSGKKRDKQYDEYYSANLFSANASIELPIDKLESRWITTILDDPYISLFLRDDEVEDLKQKFQGFSPLYCQDDVLYIDQYKDGDPFQERKYQDIAQVISKAIEEDTPELRMKYQTEKEKAQGAAGFEYNIKPYKIEYSQQNNTMILLGTFTQDPPKGAPLSTHGNSDCFYARLSNIIEIAPVAHSKYHLKARYEEDQCSEPIVLKLFDIYNAFDRFHTMFTPYRKQTKLTEPIIRHGENNQSELPTQTCIVTLWYSQRDVKEVLQKLRSFGEAVVILTPSKIRQTFADRVNDQYQLFIQAGLIKQNK